MKVRKGKSSVKKRIAVFSDTHGNLTALQAMYRDSIAQHVDEYWFIGDLLMPGPSVKPIWDILQEMKPTVIVRGNWDDLVVRGARGMMDMERPSHIYFARLAQYVAEHAPDGMVDEIEPIFIILPHFLFFIFGITFDARNAGAIKFV